MKPFGIALAARISYLQTREQWSLCHLSKTNTHTEIPPIHPPTPPSPLPEFLEDDTIRESLSADADAFQHAVTPQLLQHQLGVHPPRLQHSGQQTTNQGAATVCLDFSLVPATFDNCQNDGLSGLSVSDPLLVVGDDAADEVGLGVV